MNAERRTIRAGFLPVPALLACLLFATAVAHAEEALPATVLEIRDDPGGGKRAVATLRIAAPPDAVRAVLGDYERWPDLFAGRFRMARLERLDGRVVTDLRIKRAPLPGTMRLLCETRELPDGEIVTRLIEGDFKRYVRRWRLAAETGGGAVRTRAEMDLVVDPEMWAPGWLFAAVLRSDLEAHFTVLRRRAVERAGVR